MENEQAVNPIPPVVMVLALVIVGVELLFQAAAAGVVGGDFGIGWRVQAVTDYAFSPNVLKWMIERSDYAPELVQRFISYAFIQPNMTSAIFATAMVLALGKFVGEVFSATATLAVFLLSVIFGALVFGLVLEGSAPLIGAFPGIYGLIGAYTYILWLRLGQMGDNQLQAFRIIGVQLGLQLVYGMIFGAGVTWIAELSGFAMGFASSIILAPGGWAALVARSRQRD